MRNLPFIVAGIALIFLCAMNGITVTETHEMVWEYGEPSTKYPDAKHIIFRYSKEPSCYIGIISKQLPPYLEGLHTRQVPVVLEVHKTLFGVKSFREVRIGDLTTWDTLWAYTGYRTWKASYRVAR